jgi:hypothetical protein
MASCQDEFLNQGRHKNQKGFAEKFFRKPFIFMVGTSGLEPLTSTVSR